MDPYFVLALSFLVCFWPWISRFTTQVFLSLDSTVLYYPLTHWVHQHIPQGKLPLICDLAYHGAPVAAVSMAGVLSPVLWLFHWFDSTVVAANLTFLAPFVLFLFGTFFLGRTLGLSSTASLLLAFLWTYCGQRMAQLDHWNVAWACAFFPWAFLCLERYRNGRGFVWVLAASLFLGLNLLSGHPQLVFLEGLFFLFWIFLSPAPSVIPRPSADRRVLGRGNLSSAFYLLAGAALFASPLILFTLECHTGGFPAWNEVDRFYHSWTPANLLTLLFPWFFGRETYDRLGSDYWWQYQFVEMQAAFSIAGLFFILLFHFKEHPLRRFVAVTASFGALMAMGKFFLLYPLVQQLPFFSLFRDPARYWHLGAWALGIGAAFAWDAWFKDLKGSATGRKLVLWLSGISLGVLVLGWLLLHPGRPLLEAIAAWFAGSFLLGDGVHTQPLEHYLGRIGEKLSALSFNLDPRQPRVFLPLGFLAGLFACVWSRAVWKPNFQKAFLLTLVFADLMAFRMPLGDVFRDPTKLPPPATPATEGRSLVLNRGTVSPQPEQYAEMSQPNWNLVQGRANLAFDANPGLASYDKLLKDSGWFSWVHKDRDPMGFAKDPLRLYALGVDRIVSDVPMDLPKAFRTLQSRAPFTYALPAVLPKAIVLSTPPSGDKFFIRLPVSGTLPRTERWDETHLLFKARVRPAPAPDLLLAQKTYLPGWKGRVNGKDIQPRLLDPFLAVQLERGINAVDLRFDPAGLRLGFFLSFLLSGLLAFLGLRLRFA